MMFCLFGLHQTVITVYPAASCTVCHEMKGPVNRWKAAGVAKHHLNCLDCHFDEGFSRIFSVNRRLVEVIPIHFIKEFDTPIALPKEPLLFEEGKDPGYYSIVPNYRCFQCHEAKNHQPRDMSKIHGKLIEDISSRPCKDCHNHHMRNGQKFYDRILR